VGRVEVWKFRSLEVWRKRPGCLEVRVENLKFGIEEDEILDLKF
jgi:hypothetical protein